MSKISEKQKLLNQLEKQLAALHDEISNLQESNPLYKETWDRLVKERENLIVSTNKVESFVFHDFVEIHYKWQGINLYPKIVSHKFLCTEQIAEFLERAITDYRTLDLIFDVDDENSAKIWKALEMIDKKVCTFNNKVQKAFREFQEDQLNELLF